MYITRIQAENFKSFQALDVGLRPFNILIGPNASGKSNFIEILTFLRDVSRHGLADAASLHGGSAYLPNVRSERGESVRLGVSTGPRFCRRRLKKVEGGVIGIRSYVADYECEFRFMRRQDEVRVVSERIDISLEWAKATGSKDEGTREETVLGETHVLKVRQAGKRHDNLTTSLEHKGDDVPSELLEGWETLKRIPLEKNVLALETGVLFLILPVFPLWERNLQATSRNTTSTPK